MEQINEKIEENTIVIKELKESPSYSMNEISHAQEEIRSMFDIIKEKYGSIPTQDESWIFSLDKISGKPITEDGMYYAIIKTDLIYHGPKETGSVTIKFSAADSEHKHLVFEDIIQHFDMKRGQTIEDIEFKIPVIPSQNYEYELSLVSTHVDEFQFLKYNNSIKVTMEGEKLKMSEKQTDGNPIYHSTDYIKREGAIVLEIEPKREDIKKMEIVVNNNIIPIDYKKSMHLLDSGGNLGYNEVELRIYTDDTLTQTSSFIPIAIAQDFDINYSNTGIDLAKLNSDEICRYLKCLDVDKKDEIIVIIGSQFEPLSPVGIIIGVAVLSILLLLIIKKQEKTQEKTQDEEFEVILESTNKEDILTWIVEVR